MRQRSGARSTRARATFSGLLAVAAAAIAASPADAGLWIRTSCMNPDQSAAPSEGWTGFASGMPPLGSTNKATCGPGDPMIAFLSMGGPASHGSGEVLQYTPPDGSVLTGGTAFVGMTADGHGAGAVGITALYTPALVHDGSNVFLQCVEKILACQDGLPHYYGPIELPRDRGGNLYILAACVGTPGTFCTQGGSRGAWATAAVGWANLRLTTTEQPTGSDFRGSLLEPGAHGTATLAFASADTGPGIYNVKVTIDGHAVSDTTPNSNGGKCVPVGYDADAQALMWAWQQPCPRSQPVDLQISTTTLDDGDHDLVVTVTNAGANTTTVLRRTITTKNRTTVSSRLTSDKVPAGAAVTPPTTYGVVLDAGTRALVGGVTRVWTHSALRLSGTLRTSAGQPAPGVRVTLFSRHSGARKPRAIARTTTDLAGHWVVAAPRGPSRTLRIVYGEHPDPASAPAVKVRQTVKPAVSLHVEALGGSWARFTGRVRMRPLGNPPPYIIIQVSDDEGWENLGAAQPVTPSGSYFVEHDGGPRAIGGHFKFRAVVFATSRFAAGVSPTRKLRVR